MSMRRAIDQMCKSCIYDDFQPGTWRAQTENCVSSTCPLFKFRPLSKETLAKNAQGSAASVRMKERHRDGVLS